MTTTINEDCSEILLESDYFDPLNQSVTLTVVLNCTTTYDDIDIDVAEANYTLTPTDIESDEEAFADGIYTLTIVFVQEDGTEITEQKCVFVNCGTTCDMLETLREAVAEDDTAFIKAMAFHALLLSTSCVDCSCSDMCSLYSTATDETCVENANPCGCS